MGRVQYHFEGEKKARPSLNATKSWEVFLVAIHVRDIEMLQRNTHLFIGFQGHECANCASEASAFLLSYGK